MPTLEDGVDLIDIDDVVEVISVTDGAGDTISIDGTGPQGPPSVPGFGGFLEGPYAPRQLIVALDIPSGCTLDALTSMADSLNGALGATTWDITFDGTFAIPTQATTVEINAARFGSIAFPATAANVTSTGVFTFTTGGVIPHKGKLRVWESATPDAVLGNTALTFSGVIS